MKIWYGFLGASMTGGAAVLLFLLVSAIIKKKYKIAYTKVVWFLIALRLLVPVNMSLYPGNISIAVPSYIMVYGKLATAQSAADHTAVVNADRTQKESKASGNEKEPAANFTSMDMVMILWLAGVLIFSLFHLAAAANEARRIRRWSSVCENENTNKVFLDVAGELQISRLPQLRVSAYENSSPFTVGILHPAVIIPQKEYQGRDLYFVLKHELIHYKRKDLVFKLFLLVVNGIHWFNPAVWLMRHEAEQDMELSCDRRVLEGCDAQECREYGEVLMACVEAENQKYTAMETNYCQGTAFLKRRFREIFGDTMRKTGKILPAVMMFLVVCVGSIFTVQAGMEIPWKKIPIDNGIEVRTDVNGDGQTERVWTTDYLGEDEGYSTLTVQFRDGTETSVTDKSGWNVSDLLTGDFNKDGKADIIWDLVDIGSGGQADTVHIYHVADHELVQYPENFVHNPAIKRSQPAVINPPWLEGNDLHWSAAPMGIAIIEKNGRNYLRILYPDINDPEYYPKEDIAECVDSSYTEKGWKIENIARITDVLDKEDQLLNSNYFH